MRVFVYGTLKRGHGNNYLLRTAKFVGEAVTLTPFQLFHNGGFPMVFDRRGMEGMVAGEIYEVDEATRTRLDRLEGHPEWYQRTPIRARLTNGNETDCEIYVMQDMPGRGLAQVHPDDNGVLTWNGRA